MSAREEILARIRQASGPAPAVSREYRTSGEFTPGDPRLLDLFTERLEDYRAAVHRCTAADLPSTLEGLTKGLNVVRPSDPPLSHSELDEVDAVLTGCAAACAETGTIALDAGPDQGRRALTLIPDRHICVVHAHQVVQTVPELVRRLDPCRPLTFISGPSATSDIELNRVEGVHGPRTLIVIIVESK